MLLALFYFVFGQFDINLGNVLITESNGEYHLALIDNEGIVQKQKVKWGENPFVARAYCDTLEQDFDAPFDFQSAKRGDWNSNETQKDLEAFHLDSNRSFFHTPEGFTYILWHNRLWVQNQPNALLKEKLHFDTLPQECLERLKLLDKRALEEIWSSGLPTEWTPSQIEEYFQAILERKKMALLHL